MAEATSAKASVASSGSSARRAASAGSATVTTGIFFPTVVLLPAGVLSDTRTLPEARLQVGDHRLTSTGGGTTSSGRWGGDNDLRPSAHRLGRRSSGGSGANQARAWCAQLQGAYWRPPARSGLDTQTGRHGLSTARPPTAPHEEERLPDEATPWNQAREALAVGRRRARHGARHSRHELRGQRER